MQSPDYHTYTISHLVESPAYHSRENRFEEFTLPEDLTLGQAVELLSRRYPAPKAGLLQILNRMTILHPAAAYVLGEVIGDIAEADKSILLEDITYSYHRELWCEELQVLTDSVEAYDREVSATFEAMEEWVSSSETDELGTTLGGLSRGSVGIGGVLSHPQLQVGVVVTVIEGGSMSNRSKVVEGLYYAGKSGKSRRFSVDSIEKVLPHPKFEWSGKARLHAEGQSLDFFMPGFYEGDIPNRGILHPSIPFINHSLAIPLGRRAAYNLR